MTDLTNRPIVVGIDGSPESYEALVWAMEYARSKGAGVTAVSTWEYPPALGMYVGFEGWDPAADAQTKAEEVVAKAQAEHPGVPVELRVLEGHPAQVLVEMSKGAELLAVGSRGRGAFAGILLGSVSTHCVHAAHCPVYVYR